MSNLRKDKNGNTFENGVGEYGGFTKGAQTKKWKDGLNHGAFLCLDTFHNIGGTYFSAKGNGSKPDYLFIVTGAEDRFHLCIPYCSARRLQLIPDKYARDHVPMIASFD